jgi:hypothetical protein
MQRPHLRSRSRQEMGRKHANSNQRVKHFTPTMK